MDTIRKAFDDAGRPTLQGFRVSLSGIAMVTLAVPAHVDAAVADRTLVVNGKTHYLSHLRQVEVENAFELVIKGFYNHQDSDALEQCRAWFASFNKKQLPYTLVDTRAVANERDLLMFTMANWELTAAVLSEEGQKSFQQHFKDYGLHEPVLLYRYNSTSAISNRRDTATAIADGADAVTSVVSSLQKRIEKQERDAIARDADTKNRLDSLASNLHDLTTFTSTLANRQEEMGRGLFILHQQTALDMDSSRIENRIALARNTFRFPLDNDEKEAARIEIVELEAKRSQIAGKLDALRASTNGSLIAVPGPAIAPPPASDTSPWPTKRLRSSLDGATVVDGGTNAQAPGPDMQDQHMGEATS
ncbi:hypothetical protein B0H14DRAFT_2673571 [Mycena olivaceomarginata]|nr:hypothetical protein B0H14DRAFT_2673571 [Mycena olivaceomarginata]